MKLKEEKIFSSLCIASCSPAKRSSVALHGYEIYNVLFPDGASGSLLKKNNNFSLQDFYCNGTL